MKKLLLALMAIVVLSGCDGYGSWEVETEPTPEYSKDLRIDTLDQMEVYIDKNAVDVWIRRQTPQGAEYLRAVTTTDSNLVAIPGGVIIIILLSGILVGLAISRD